MILTFFAKADCAQEEMINKIGNAVDYDNIEIYSINKDVVYILLYSFETITAYIIKHIEKVLTVLDYRIYDDDWSYEADKINWKDEFENINIWLGDKRI